MDLALRGWFHDRISLGGMFQMRDHPRYRVTWLAKVIAGERQCRWSVWFQGNHEYEPLSSSSGNSNLAVWTAEHNVLLETRAGKLVQAGFKVTLEEQNSFTVVGRTGIEVVGKPDIIAVKDHVLDVEDAKTGRPRASDHVQVGLYVLLVKEVTVGHVVYTGATEHVAPFNPKLLTSAVESLTTEPARVPSYWECRWCDIPNCPVRVAADPMKTTTEIF
jgi:hypothetical protein